MRAPALLLSLLAIALFVAGCGGPEDSDATMAAACERQIAEVEELAKEEAGNTPVAKSTEEAVANEQLVECAGQKPESAEESLPVKGEEAKADAEAEDTESGGTESAGAELDAAARELFVSTCGGCHALSDAETTGAVGPNLDDTTLDAAGVGDMIANGRGAMPGGLLEGEDATAVAEYVAAAAAAE